MIFYFTNSAIQCAGLFAILPLVYLRTVSLCHLQKVSWCQVSPTELLKSDCARPTLPCSFIPGHRSWGPGDSLESGAELGPGAR